MGLEGALRVSVHVERGHIERIRVTSTRPEVAATLLQGRARSEVAAAVPRLFSICAHSQSVASELACSAAALEPLADERLARGRAAVCTEMAREGAWRVLLDWPKRIGETPTDEAVAAARASLAFRFDAPCEAGPAIARATFGCAAGEWLSRSSLPELDRWIDAGATATARFIRRVRDDEPAAGQALERAPRRVADLASRMPRLLAAAHDTAWTDELSTACDTDPSFARQPSWRGAPAETGALARQQGDPLIAALVQRSTSRVPARFVARVRELALLLAGQPVASIGVAATPSGGGLGWVENARGLLVHQVRLHQGRAAAYQIVAPTEWNFHPAGALPAELRGAAVADPADARARTEQVVLSLDPCVACHVELEDA